MLYLSDGLQNPGCLNEFTGESQHSTVDAGVIEDIRQLLTDLIGDVVRDTGRGNDCTKKRRATDVPDSSSEPSCKRPFSTVTQRTIFDPVAEHHLWCPYASDVVCSGPNDIMHNVAQKPWLRLLRQLVPDLQAALTRIQTSPVPDGIERIRKLFRTWTSSA